MLFFLIPIVSAPIHDVNVDALIAARVNVIRASEKLSGDYVKAFTDEANKIRRTFTKVKETSDMINRLIQAAIDASDEKSKDQIRELIEQYKILESIDVKMKGIDEMTMATLSAISRESTIFRTAILGDIPEIEGHRGDLNAVELSKLLQKTGKRTSF